MGIPEDSLRSALRPETAAVNERTGNARTHAGAAVPLDRRRARAGVPE